MQNWTKNLQLTTKLFLCAAAASFPFSVAATNTALALALTTGLVTRDLQQGALMLWRSYKSLAISILSYLGLVLAGLLWSLDHRYGVEVAAHLWLWLLLPLIIQVLSEDKWRGYFLASLSSGLVLHLLYCVLQRFGIVPVPESAGSSLTDATGYIGHISFGIVYGVWGGWLLHFGWQNQEWKRILSWALSLWAFAMIFLAEGRSGYLVAAVILLIVFWKHLISGHGFMRMIGVIAVFAVLAAVVVLGPGKERIGNTVNGIEAAMKGDLSRVEERWIIWLSTTELWKDHPLAGVGTGGYSAGIKEMQQRHPDEPLFKMAYSHSHNIYLQSLVRWGPAGLLVILAMFWNWLRAGISRPWTTHTNAFVILSGIALMIHGLSSVSLEEHFATIFALFALAVGLSAKDD